jgi:hypothetical protein
VLTAHTSCAACVLLVACLAYSSILKMVAVRPSNFYRRHGVRFQNILLPLCSPSASLLSIIWLTPFGPEDGSSTSFRNVGKLLQTTRLQIPEYTTSALPAICFLLIHYLACPLVLKMEAARPSETSVNFYRPHGVRSQNILLPLCSPSASLLSITWLTHWSWRWNQYVPPKRR